MKALTIQQPWASMIVEGTKLVEFRSWNIGFHGQFLIHAGRDAQKDVYALLPSRRPDTDPRGYLLGVADLVDYVAITADNIDQLCKGLPRKPGPEFKWAFILRNPRRLRVPIKQSGFVKFFDVNIDPKTLEFEPQAN